MFVVTGTPRSATGYASLLFSELGVPCTHEQLFRPRACLQEVLEWSAAGGDKAESSWLAWAFLGMLPKPVPVLHTVRNPWKVIDSLAHRNDILPEGACIDKGKVAYREAVRAYCPQVYEHEDAVNRAAAMVVLWNERIEDAALNADCKYIRYRVEDLDATQVAAVLDFVGIWRDATEINRALAAVPKNVNGGKNIEYGIPITNPVLAGYLKKVAPEANLVIERAFSESKPLGRDGLAAMLEPELRDGVEELADRYGYPAETTTEDETPIGATGNACKQCENERHRAN